jgi:hypothetical protein
VVEVADRNVVEQMLDAEKLIASAAVLLTEAHKLAPGVASSSLSQAGAYLDAAAKAFHRRAGNAQVKVNELVDQGVSRETALKLIELGTVTYPL